MENNIQIGLFFERKFIFDPLTVANKLKEKIPELGEAVLLPVDEKSNAPVIIYEKGSLIRIAMSFSSIMITLVDDKDKFSIKSLKNIFEILKKIGIKITRLGYIINVVLGEKEANLFKNNAFESKEIINANEFQLSYYKKDMMAKYKINCWKRYFTDLDKFIISFDINTIIDDKHDITYSFTIDFISLCHDYIEKNQIVTLI